MPGEFGIPFQNPRGGTAAANEKICPHATAGLSLPAGPMGALARCSQPPRNLSVVTISSSRRNPDRSPGSGPENHYSLLPHLVVEEVPRFGMLPFITGKSAGFDP